MKIPRTGPIWFAVVGIPCLFLCVLGLIAGLTGLRRLDALCQRWLLEISGGGRMNSRPENRPTFARLCWLFNRFKDASVPLSSRLLAREYEVCSKTIERDIELLRMVGCEIESELSPVGARLGYRMKQPAPCPCCSAFLNPSTPQLATAS